ncbi:transposase [Paraburkholderia sp. UYCP14C]|uniref:transposase n=1 Tax=Paraburkholderia sp. UYCP14C TaxID=2511130 RepID=UPI00145A0163|nr:transposase [Paraburkholderia sp. UYCP14C]
MLRLRRRHRQPCDEIAQIEGELKPYFGEDEAGQKLLTIPGIGPHDGRQPRAMAGDAHGFRRGRDFAASLGLEPWQHATGGRLTLLGISKATGICDICRRRTRGQ